jgi:hypothetical protein
MNFINGLSGKRAYVLPHEVGAVKGLFVAVPQI